MSEAKKKTSRKPSKKLQVVKPVEVKPEVKAPQEAKPAQEDPKAGWPSYCRHLSVSAYTRWLAYLEEQRPLLASRGVDPSLDMAVFLKVWMTGGKGMNEARTYAKLRVSHPDPAAAKEEPSKEE